ncbi:Cu2+-exporting ATPase [Pseudofulvimonas gallinarii]|uniref:Cu2+-exporting ATPase n=3 Tax=Pseudofulvimonas gallinarii TaxID=634155 RepID=A0A4R3LHL6_9GAMM|nr:Cu2+-exporting ATPase [Pseudofulvimonas gallinarii]
MAGMDTASCFHCGEPLPASPVVVRIGDHDHPMCCSGCAAAASWISDAGLDDYYRLRSADGLRVDVADSDFSAWDRADVLAAHARGDERERGITVLVEGIRCAACAWLIGRALSPMPGVVEAEANAVTGRLQLRWQPEKTALSVLLQRLASLGYRPHLATGEATEQARRAERRDLLKRLLVAGLGTVQAMMMAEALYLDFHNTMPVATRDFMRWLCFALSTPVVFYSGQPFLRGMANELRLRRFGMDTLIASSVLIAWAASVLETFRGGPHVWYDAAVMFVLFLLVARYLERMARQRAQAAVDTLARARPALAWRETHDGQSEQVPLHALAIGDIARVRAGDTVPADGILLEAPGEFDEALLSGESRPVLHQPGDTVLAGSLAVNSPARLRVERTGQDTVLSDLVRLVEQAQAQRPQLARVADAIASRFVLGLLLSAVVIAVAWRFHQPDRALEVTLALLIISCPCALSLAIPAALAASHARLASMGVLVLGNEGLDTLARADIIVLDKTGTLSTGRQRIDDIETRGDLDATQVQAIAAALERHSSHPIASAFTSNAGATPLRAGDVTITPGAGLEGRIAGVHYRLGRADFALGPAARVDGDRIWLSRIDNDDTPTALAGFRVGDDLRPCAADAMARLRAQQLELVILSGDGPAAVADVGARLGIADRRARQRPQDKLDAVRALQDEGHVVAMLGDGINDAPVLAGADVSIALGHGAPNAHRAADIVLLGDSLLRVPQTIDIARRCRRVIRQNLAWAAAYNLIALPIAALGLVTPWLAALGMAASSLIVTGNALRLSRSPAVTMARLPSGHEATERAAA